MKANGKRKAREAEKDTGDNFERLLTSSKSKLTKIDLLDLLNYENFLDLSPDSQDLLVSLLPPTAFSTFRPSISPTHIDYAAPNPTSISTYLDLNANQVDGTLATGSSYQSSPTPQKDHPEQSIGTLDPTTFTSPFFLSAARTFQDHLYSGWFAKKAREDVAQFEAGVRDGSLHAEWKDQVWEREHPPGKERAKSLDLTALVKRGFLREGDVLCYRRNFPFLQLVVEKDILIDSIQGRNHTLSVLVPSETIRSLPPPLLLVGQQGPEPKDHIQFIEDIADPVVLEDGLLDIDGRVRRAERHPATADAHTTSNTSWKSFTVWRWRDEMRDEAETQSLQERGGRERVGSLFYLRAYCSAG